MIFLDTHAVIWLYQKELHKFGPDARRNLELEPLYISPAVILEIEYLHEIGRITLRATPIVDFLIESIGLQIDPTSFYSVAAEALRQSWARDPFDRLIVSQAAFHRAPLVTKDERIAKHYSPTLV